MASFKPALLYGYSSAIYLLALEALECSARVGSLKLVILTSEQVTRDIRNAVERAFQADVVEEYGAAECQVIAYEDNERFFRVREDLVFLETLPVEGGYYRIVVSVLNNPSFPLLRYDIGDLTDRPVNRIATGFALMGPLIGRKNDFLISRSGRRVHPLDASFLEHHTLIKRFRVHQFSDGRVMLLLEVDSKARNLDPSSLGRKLSDLLEGQAVEVRLTDSIPPTAPGKHAWIVSELAKLDSS
jgi:phenylacetate-CoA ligase